MSKKEYNYEHEDGKIVRTIEFDITLFGEIVTSKTLANTVRYYFDTDGKMTKKVVKPTGGNAQTIYFENTDDNIVTKFTAGGKTITSHSKNDSFGRKVFDELQLGTGFVSRQFHYHSGEVTEEHKDAAKLKSSATTQLVSQIVLSGGRTISYEYDAEERITKVIDSVDGTTEYTYDELGQLLTETHEGEVINTMTYDNYGNILSKNGVAYTYDSTWKDKLIGYGEQGITYDAQGNPTSYLGHTLVWEKGIQVKSFDSATYTYNANGVRTSKTVDGVEHIFTLEGSKILRETWGINTLVPLYDNEESVCGIIFNNEPFYFQKNMQGDIIAILNKDAQVVVKYSYDAWGACTVTQDTSDCGIANINPYRYRGYYYDPEIQMYYLQSRYYNPAVGRFVNADSVLDSRNALGYNLFAYCWNSPTNYQDENGHYTGTLILSSAMTYSLSGALSGIMTGISASIASIKAAIATSWFIPVCIAAAAIAIVGIVYVVNKVCSLMKTAEKVRTAVISNIKKNGVRPGGGHTVYVITPKKTLDVVYVGRTCNFARRMKQHEPRFPSAKYDKFAVATGLTLAKARTLEQTLITAYGLGTLINMINSISPRKWSKFKEEYKQMRSLIDSWIDPE